MNMNIENVFTSLLLGSDFDYVLFKAAIAFAEIGMNVWFISPEVFEKIPENIIPPDKEILQLITFFYLKDHKDLLSHLNGVHLWHRMPNIIILSSLETYCHFQDVNYNPLLAGLISTSLLDSISVCAKKKQDKVYLILTCSQLTELKKGRLQVLHDLYFPHIISKIDDELLLDNIVNYFLNK